MTRHPSGAFWRSSPGGGGRNGSAGGFALPRGHLAAGLGPPLTPPPLRLASAHPNKQNARIEMGRPSAASTPPPGSVRDARLMVYSEGERMTERTAPPAAEGNTTVPFIPG